MKVQHLEIINFKGIKDLSVPLKGRNVYAIGGNGVGKSSFIDSVFKTLTGKNLPTQLTTKGERRGAVNIDLGSINVGASFDAKKEKMNLVVASSDGEAYSSPRTMLDALVGVIDFDVAGFMALTPRKQVEKLKEILGLDLSDLDAEYKKLYDARTESNREVKYLEAQCKPFDSTKTDAINISELEESRMQLTRTNLTRKAKEEEELRLSREIEEGNARLNRLREEMEKLDAELTQKTNATNDVQFWLMDNPYSPDDEIVEAISNAKLHNEAVENTRRGLMARQNVKDEEARNKQLVDDLAAVEQKKANRIAEVEMPVPGLTFTDDGLFLDGLPFESGQINTARQIIAGLQLCSAMHKQINIARFDGSLLDKANLKEVEDWAASKDIQLFIELVERNGSDGLQIQISE